MFCLCVSDIRVRDGSIIVKVKQGETKQNREKIAVWWFVKWKFSTKLIINETNKILCIQTLINKQRQKGKKRTTSSYLYRNYKNKFYVFVLHHCVSLPFSLSLCLVFSSTVRITTLCCMHTCIHVCVLLIRFCFKKLRSTESQIKLSSLV